MRPFIRFIHPFASPILVTLTVLVSAGCATRRESTASKSAPEGKAQPSVASVAEPMTNTKADPVAIRIRAGTSQSYTDSSGNTWLPDQGFADGETVERPDIAIGNTKDPGIYRAERYSMTSFSWPLANGKYTVLLHFAETYEGITGPGERVFSFNVQGREFKDFDVFAKAGGDLRAYIETIKTEITDRKLQITFTPQIENPQINGIEIIPGW